MQKQRELNQSQLDLLHTLYRFRFATRSLLAEYLNKPNNTSLYSKLSILEKRGLVGSLYEKSYKLAGREAEYYVTPKGVRTLRDSSTMELSDTDIQASYKDKRMSDWFVQQVVLLFAFRNMLIKAYPTLQYFTSRDIQKLDYFPSRKPTAFLSLKTDDKVRRFFLEYIPMQTSTTIIKAKLRRYSHYFDEDAWGVTNTDFPFILFVCDDGMTEQGVRWHIKRELFKSDTDIQYYTTTRKALLTSLPGNPAIWSSIEDDDALYSLAEL
jgi:hypothetical protein